MEPIYKYSRRKFGQYYRSFIECNHINIMKQTEAYLRATVSPSNASYKTVTWSSSDNTIATVTNGVVYGKKPGNATITCTTTHGGKTATCEVTVTEIERLATGLELYKSAYWKNGQSMVPYSSINEGDTLTFMELGIGFITINVLPYSVTNGEINWKVSDPSIVATELTEHINFQTLFVSILFMSGQQK